MFADNCGSTCISTNKNFLGLGRPGIGAPLIILFGQGIFYFVVLFFCESGHVVRARRRFARRSHRLMRTNPLAVSSRHSLPGDDSDVIEERDRILFTPLDELFKTDCLVVRDLSKSFAGFRAVSHLSFGIQKVLSTLIFRQRLSDIVLRHGINKANNHWPSSSSTTHQRSLMYC